MGRLVTADPRDTLPHMTTSRTTDGSAPSDDHEFAAWAATLAGRRLTEVRAEGLEGRALKDAGDRAAHDLLMALCAEHRPDDAVMSEESAASIENADRLTASRVWIIDPLDGTREFSEPPRDDWAVHVALWQDGELVAGAVAQPGLGTTFDTGNPPTVPARSAQRPRIAVSRTRPPSFVEGLAEALGADLVPMGSAGAKVISVVRDVTDAYVHAGGQYEWDSAAPVAVARAAGLHTSRIDGSPLVYNQRDVLLPDLVVCRPELADAILDYVRRAGVE
jgi:3'(2'), 5'-bisphosphate nucleotidase